jgi:AP-4 complex subunit mu-1
LLPNAHLSFYFSFLSPFPYLKNQATKRVTWKIRKFPGGTEQTIRARIVLSETCTPAIRKEIGPVTMNFEIPMYNPSNLQVRYLRILENKNYNPFRWVRYVTRSQSYVCRL